MKFRAIRSFLLDTLRGRLIIGVALVHAVMMTLFVIDLTVRQRAMLLDHQEEDAKALSQSLSTSAATWLAADDVSGLQELVEAQRRYPELVFAILADENGRVLAHTDKSKLGLYLADLSGEDNQTVIGKTPELVDVATPAMLGGKRVGWARVGIGQKTAGRKLSEITLSGAHYALVAILIGSAIAWLMGRQLTRRLYAVQNTINEVREGKHSARSLIVGTDEAALLAREFNAMLDALEVRDAKLIVSEERFRKLFNTAAVPLCFVNTEGMVVDFNDRFMQTFGYTHEDLPTLKEWWRLAYPDPDYRSWVVATWDAAVRRASEEKTDIQPIEYRVTCKNGETRTMVISGSILDNNLLATFFDITERKLAEEAIRKAGGYNRSLIEASLDPLVTIGPDGRIIDVNTATEAVTGHSREKLIGTDFSNYFTEPENARAGYLQVFKEGLVRDYPLEIRKKDGRLTSVLYNAAVYQDEGGQVLGVFAAARDITESKRAEEEIRKLNAELELRVAERTAELECKNAELENLNKVFVGRELRMIELKERIKELEGRLQGES